MLNFYIELLQQLPKGHIESCSYDGDIGYIALKNGELVTCYPDKIIYKSSSYTSSHIFMYYYNRE